MTHDIENCNNCSADPGLDQGSSDDATAQHEGHAETAPGAFIGAKTPAPQSGVVDDDDDDIVDKSRAEPTTKPVASPEGKARQEKVRWRAVLGLFHIVNFSRARCRCCACSASPRGRFACPCITCTSRFTRV